MVPGGAEAGEAMCTDPNIAMISFTGSARGGSRVAEVAGRHFKKVQLELGGKNSLIVLDDADLDIAASNAAWGAFMHQGQICMATGLILAQAAIADALAERLAAKAQHLPVGDPSTNQVALGPIISDGQVESIQAIVDDAVAKGARLLAGGTHDGRFYAATVLAGVKPGMRAFDEEIFGPSPASRRSRRGRGDHIHQRERIWPRRRRDLRRHRPGAPDRRRTRCRHGPRQRSDGERAARSRPSAVRASPATARGSAARPTSRNSPRGSGSR